MNYIKRNLHVLIIQPALILILSILNINPLKAQTNTPNTSNAIYVITNRSIDTTHTDLRFKNDVNENAPLVFSTSSLSDSEKAVNQLLTHDEFMSQVCSKPSDWLLFVHGDGKTHQQAVKRGFKIQKRYNINVIVFSWSSKDSNLNGLKNFNNSKRNVLKSKQHFSQLMAFMDTIKKTNKRLSQKSKLSMFIHSLGNLHLECWAKESSKNLNNNIVFDNIIINSAAVNQKDHQIWVEKIKFQKRVYITNNKQDFNLKGLHIFSKARNQLGEKAKKPTTINAHYINFSKAIGFRFPTPSTHTYFIGNVPTKSENIFKFYSNVLHGNEVDLMNQGQFMKRKHKVGHCIIF